jgi:hypothetical protein
MNPITYTEMKCYFDLVEIRPEAWELELIKRLDVVALNAFAKQSEAEKQKQNKK